MVITPLGSGQEVGRSCHLLEFRGMTIMLDCGIHPGYEGLNSLPFFDRVEPESVDVLLVTHFHLDHAGSLPYFTERTVREIVVEWLRSVMFVPDRYERVCKVINKEMLRVVVSGIDNKIDELIRCLK